MTRIGIPWIKKPKSKKKTKAEEDGWELKLSWKRIKVANLHEGCRIMNFSHIFFFSGYLSYIVGNLPDILCFECWYGFNFILLICFIKIFPIHYTECFKTCFWKLELRTSKQEQNTLWSSYVRKRFVWEIFTPKNFNCYELFKHNK